MGGELKEEGEERGDGGEGGESTRTGGGEGATRTYNGVSGRKRKERFSTEEAEEEERGKK
jgi:hypothetical protein